VKGLADQVAADRSQKGPGRVGELGQNMSGSLTALAFVFWGHPTATVMIVIAVLLLIVLGLIALTGQPPTQPGPAPHASGG
jgi:hypothetical protein